MFQQITDNVAAYSLFPDEDVFRTMEEHYMYNHGVCFVFLSSAVNIARSGEATQSSTYVSGVSSVASNAIDGRKDQDWNHNSCTATNEDWEPWWRLDLKQKQSVYVIKVYARSDRFLERLKDLEVRIGDSPDNNNPLCGTITNYNIITTTFCCNGLAGRYVSTVIPGRSECLTLCEVEVYNGTMTENDVCW
ncbi:PREDICTED: fucolectin-like [Nanorana parkeri]|uniref:fucolectin-like n=1 Tax=Nanorana parkeri TaxID=125878 RepID=UPI00085401B5|nr:PREDICTED: fucolectin-like [Nanorana parkeri]